jgi:hypothetical protein
MNATPTDAPLAVFRIRIRIRNPDPIFHQNLDPDWIRTRIGIHPKLRDPDPYQMNTDPKH